MKIKRKMIRGNDCRITFYKPINLTIRYYKKEKIYVVRYAKTIDWGHGPTIQEAIKEIADCFEHAYFHGLHTQPSKASQSFEDDFKYLREIIKDVTPLKKETK